MIVHSATALPSPQKIVSSPVGFSFTAGLRGHQGPFWEVVLKRRALPSSPHWTGPRVPRWGLLFTPLTEPEKSKLPPWEFPVWSANRNEEDCSHESYVRIDWFGVISYRNREIWRIATILVHDDFSFSNFAGLVQFYHCLCIPRWMHLPHKRNSMVFIENWGKLWNHEIGRLSKSFDVALPEINLPFVRPDPRKYPLSIYTIFFKYILNIYI